MFEESACWCFAESDGSGGRERAMSMAGASGGGVKDKDRKIGHRRVNEDGEVRIHIFVQPSFRPQRLNLSITRKGSLDPGTGLTERSRSRLF